MRHKVSWAWTAAVNPSAGGARRGALRIVECKMQSLTPSDRPERRRGRMRTLLENFSFARKEHGA